MSERINKEYIKGCVIRLIEIARTEEIHVRGRIKNNKINNAVVQITYDTISNVKKSGDLAARDEKDDWFIYGSFKYSENNFTNSLELFTFGIEGNKKNFSEWFTMLMLQYDPDYKKIF